MLDLRFSDAELDQRRDHILAFIQDRVDAAGADGAVLGLSGGIDSTLTAFLAVEALGAEHVHGLVLPATVSSEGNMSDAERVAQDLEISYDVIEIEPLVDSLLEVYPGAEGDREAVGNARARVRGVMNYLVANHENRLVLGTGNRSEAAVGYFTKYGDGAVDCHPIGTLYKGQVRQLARHVGVPEELAAKTATAELWADQTDEDELGLSYEVLDSILATHIDGPLSVGATCRLLEVDVETVERVRTLYEQSEHKRHVPPAPDPLE
ncbi:NAD+ synthase [Natronolimnobius baerhuensis]|uniref:NH(3)-dependent NAD(+) synthetase n=1 Tax=Natronolimnobius baerhuensis TaxID=253108 RepID=A0A202E6A5_9EURY|nr:NAD+ synthase [Natronolimnobius baerhuensis]OVE83724.1 NAD+ synthase [Natronolimnobius baerhuensis]